MRVERVGGCTKCFVADEGYRGITGEVSGLGLDVVR